MSQKEGKIREAQLKWGGKRYKKTKMKVEELIEAEK